LHNDIGHFVPQVKVKVKEMSIDLSELQVKVKAKWFQAYKSKSKSGMILQVKYHWVKVTWRYADAVSMPIIYLYLLN